MKKIILIGGAAALVAGLGGAGAVFLLLPHHAPAPVAAVVIPPKPINFAAIAGIIVNVPADTGDAASSMVQLDIQFATTDPNAVNEFNQLQPIIKSDLITLLMSQTVKTLQDPTARATLTQSATGIINNILTQSANYTPANPFTAAYITNLVVQD